MGISLVWEAVHTWGQGLCGNSLHSMSHFAVNLELLQRNKAYSKRKLDIQAANEETCAGKQKHWKEYDTEIMQQDCQASAPSPALS